MALTQADKTELLNAIKAESQSVDELTQVTSLDGIVSLPAIRGTEGKDSYCGSLKCQCCRLKSQYSPRSGGSSRIERQCGCRQC